MSLSHTVHSLCLHVNWEWICHRCTAVSYILVWPCFESAAMSLKCSRRAFKGHPPHSFGKAAPGAAPLPPWAPPSTGPSGAYLMCPSKSYPVKWLEFVRPLSWVIPKPECCCCWSDRGGTRHRVCLLSSPPLWCCAGTGLDKEEDVFRVRSALLCGSSKISS